MCNLCKKEQEFLSEDEARARSKARHTMPWLQADTEPPDRLLDPEGYDRFMYHAAKLESIPDPPRHPSVSGLRQHWGKGESPCGPCREFRKRPDYPELWRRDALERVEARLRPNSGVSEDPELRAFYERKRERLLKKLAGEEKKPVKKTEPMTMLPSVRVPDRLLDGLKDRAAEEGVSFSDLVRRALDEWMML